VSAQQLGLVALGDSTTVGIGDPVPGTGWRGWSRLLADELARTHRLAYANLAVSGATASSMRATQLPAALRLRPQLASVVVGVNDTMRSTWDPRRVHDDIVACVGGLAEAGALVMTLRFHDHGGVLGLPAVLRRPLWRRIEVVNAAYDAAFAAYGGIRVDLTADSVVRERGFWSIDRLHPSELGHRRLAVEFALALQGRGYPLACPGWQGFIAPRRTQELWWLMSQGLPWLGRRANDLVPWAARMVATEAVTKARSVRVRTNGDIGDLGGLADVTRLHTDMTADTHRHAMSATPSVHPAASR
jgi:lysophospholipase L1-like esterase